MFIPKNKMMVITSIIDAGLQTIGGVLKDDEREIINRLADKVAQCQMGDGNFLEVQIYYGHKPEQGI